MCVAAILCAALAIGCGGSGFTPGTGLDGPHTYNTFVDGAIAAGLTTQHAEIVTDEDLQTLRVFSWYPRVGGGRWLPMVGAEVNRYDGPLSCGANDARLLYDPQIDRYFDFSVGTSANGNGYCLGVGRGSPFDIWGWNPIFFSDEPQDGARPAASDTQISLVAVGDSDRYWLCDKQGLIAPNPKPNPCTEYSHDPSFKMRVNVVGSNGSTGAHPLFLGGQQADASDPYAAQLVLFDPITGSYQTVFGGILRRGAFTQTFSQHPNDSQVWLAPIIKDAVLDRTRNVIWVAFVTSCPLSGAHPCVGAMKIAFTVFGMPYQAAQVWFDTPASYLGDATQPTLAIDTHGNVLMGWIETGLNTALSHAVGGFSGALTGNNYLTSWRSVSGGTAEPTPHLPYSRFDILQMTMLPGTDLAVSRGVYGAPGDKLYSSIVFFGANCDPVTGKCS